MALFKKREQQPSPPGPSTPEPKKPDFHETTQRLSAALNIFATGDLRDPDAVMTIMNCLGAGAAPFHFPETSIWARCLPFADEAVAHGEWLVVVQLHKVSDFWNDDMGPAFQQTNPRIIQMIGWARPEERRELRDRAFTAAQQLPPDTVIFPVTGESVGTYLLSESTALVRVVDWLANPVPPSLPGPTSRERLDAVIERSRRGDPDAVAFEKAIAAQSDEESRRLFDEAASLGSIDAMEAAAEMAYAAGDSQSELFWAETAANAGSVKGMNRLFAILFAAGRIDEANTWLERAGVAGDSDAYWMLARMANENGDHATALRWAEKGSVAGNAECIRMRGSYALNQGADGLVAAHSLFVEAARRGSDRAMFQAGLLAQALNHQEQAKYWFTRAASLGNEEALGLLGSD